MDTDFAPGPTGHDAPATWSSEALQVVGRQPIVDSNGDVVAFQLLYRRAAGAGQGNAPHDAFLTWLAMLSTLGADLTQVVGDREAYIAVDRAVLTGDTSLSLPADRTVLEIHPSLPLDLEGLAGCAQLRSEGYRVAVPDEVVGPLGIQGQAMLEIADVVKVDLRGSSRSRVLQLLDTCRSHEVTVVAECLTTGDLDWALGTGGFHLFQGRALPHHEGVTGTDLTPSALTQARLATELLRPDLDFAGLEAILRVEPGLVVQLLRMASQGAHSGMRREIRSLREALVLLGTVRIRQWAAVTVLGRQRSATADALTTALVRARMCELVAQRENLDRGSAFTVGLLSSLDLLLGVELAEIESRLDIDPALAAAAFHGKTGLGALVRRIVDYQRAVESKATGAVASFGELELVGAMAFCWATAMVTAMDGDGRG